MIDFEFSTRVICNNVYIINIQFNMYTNNWLNFFGWRSTQGLLKNFLTFYSEESIQPKLWDFIQIFCFLAKKHKKTKVGLPQKCTPIPKLDPEETDSASEGEDEFHAMKPLTSLQTDNSKLSGHQFAQKCREVFDSIRVTSDQVK